MNATVLSPRSLISVIDGYLQRFPSEGLSLRELVLQVRADAQNVLLRSNTRGHVTSSCLVLNPTRTHVLLIHHVALRCWLPPGGHFELATSLEASALREVTEETGAEARLCEWGDTSTAGLPLDIDTHPIPPNLKKGEAGHLHHDFMYLALADDHTPLVPQRNEVHDARWMRVEPLLSSGDRRLARVLAKCERLGLLVEKKPT